MMTFADGGNNSNGVLFINLPFIIFGKNKNKKCLVI